MTSTAPRMCYRLTARECCWLLVGALSGMGVIVRTKRRAV